MCLPRSVIASFSMLSAAACYAIPRGLVLDSPSGLSRGWLGPCKGGPSVLSQPALPALSGWLRWQAPSGQAALPVITVMAGWGFEILGFSVQLRYSGKKTWKY